MLIATLCAGDTLVTLVRVTPLDIAVDDPTYNLTFTDIPTDKSYTKSYTQENSAMYALAAWIAADDAETFPLLSKIRRELYVDAAMRDHMP